MTVTREMADAAWSVLRENFEIPYNSARQFVHDDMTPEERKAGFLALKEADQKTEAEVMGLVARAISAALEVQKT